MIPPSLFLFYLFKSDGIFEDYCSFCFVTSFILGIGGIICTWLVPDDYNLGQVCLCPVSVVCVGGVRVVAAFLWGVGWTQHLAGAGCLQPWTGGFACAG
jgi:hypothetical protein